MITFGEWLMEMRKGAVNFLQQKYPAIPDYVKKDLIYRTFKDNPQYGQELARDFEKYEWQLKSIHITLDIFSNDTTRRMKARQFGNINPYQVPNDKDRHQKQKELLTQKGISKEPIIVIQQTDGKYDLIEGWHRTMQALQMYPQGYAQQAWIGSGPKQALNLYPQNSPYQA